ncbi:hypothetical protein HOF92_14155 [bacterium]|jgi:predicted transcriptional regulator of viral defense system|nr:hypothetical protein [bacterium]
MAFAKNYIDSLLQRGRHHFTMDDMVLAMQKTPDQVYRSLKRLISKGVLASPQRGFYVSIPPEYHSLGCLPPEQFIPQLMEFTGESYYLALLTAAQFHGAAHHFPQRFQVMVTKPRSSIVCGKVHVDFFVRKNLEEITTVTKTTPRGYARLSSPEATALDLVGYARSAGGLDHVATVLSELWEVMNSDNLLEESKKSPLSWVQRLGLILESVDASDITSLLQGYVQEHAHRVTPLDSSLSITGAKRCSRWKVAINTAIEADL